MIQGRNGSDPGLRHDVVTDQVVVLVRDRCNHTVVQLLHRVGEVAGLTHRNVRLKMELVEQVDYGVDRGSRGVVELEVVHIVRGTTSLTIIILLRGHTQKGRVIHRERLHTKLIVHNHRPRRRQDRREDAVHFKVGVHVGDRRDHAAMGLLHWIGKPERPIDNKGQRPGVELISQEYLDVERRVVRNVGLEVV